MIYMLPHFTCWLLVITVHAMEIQFYIFKKYNKHKLHSHVKEGVGGKLTQQSLEVRNANLQNSTSSCKLHYYLKIYLNI